MMDFRPVLLFLFVLPIFNIFKIGSVNINMQIEEIS
jgi:hypothetical protein